MLLLVVAAYWLAFQAAHLFLADIFEKEETVGSEFIKQAAFASGYNAINISKGKMHPAFEDSPILLIGGPGESAGGIGQRGSGRRTRWVPASSAPPDANLMGVRG